MKHIGRKGIALAAAFLLLSLAAQPRVAYSAGGIETGRTDCTITFELSISGQEDSNQTSAPGAADLNTSSIAVDLYRVASVDVSGNYQADGLYAEDLGGALQDVDSNTTAQTWEELARTAYDIAVPKAAEEETPAAGDTPVKSIAFTIEEDTEDRTVTGLETGLYLAVVEEVLTDEYIYHFMPCLIALPGNQYDPSTHTNDDWLYEVTANLKPEWEARCGDLEIVKTLNSYNQTLGSASFIFEIRAEKDEEIVYSDVRSLVYDGVGTKSVRIEGKIPVGAYVTVTEVYSGAGYEVTEGTEREQHPVIAADQTAVVRFSNDYDGRVNSGTSIVNAFSPRENEKDVWEHQQLLDSLGNPAGR